jgi:IS605 OrfB family transposase
VVCKLAPTPEQASDIDATLRAFAAACDFAADVARRIGSTNKVKVQHAGYTQIRQRFGLSANLAIRAIARACAALKVPAKMHSKFAPTAIDYDARIFAFQEWNWTFSLTLLFGRARIATVLGQRQKSLLKGRKPTAAVLVKRRDGRYFLHVQIREDAPDPIEPEDFLGVDLGIANIATDSQGQTFSGETTNRNRRRRATARKQYQRKGTKNAKRRLKKISGRQRRFQAKINHEISKRIVAKAKALGVGIALEDLSGIRSRIEPTAGKAFRRRFGNWGFFQLRTFIAYKAQAAGVSVVVIDPKYTSQTCSACGHREKSNRMSPSEFHCKGCGHQAHADLNAARNVRAWANRKLASKASAQARCKAAGLYFSPSGCLPQSH